MVEMRNAYKILTGKLKKDPFEKPRNKEGRY
jgi:hypothetical protein